MAMLGCAQPGGDQNSSHQGVPRGVACCRALQECQGLCWPLLGLGTKVEPNRGWSRRLGADRKRCTSTPKNAVLARQTSTHACCRHE